MHAFDTPPFPINIRHAMCVVPIIDEEGAIANAALHANIIKEIENIEAHFTKPRLPSTLLPSILLPGKCAETVKFQDISSNCNACTSTDVNANTDAVSFCNLPNSAVVRASAEICFVSVHARCKTAARRANGCTCYRFFDLIYAES
jgi:hypothetical protein